MPIRPTAAALTLCLLSLAAAARAEPPSSAQLLLRGDRLADEKKYGQALVAYQRAYELILPQLRRRPFLRNVAPRIMKRPELQQYLAREFAEQMGERKLRFMDRTVKLFGFAPQELDVKQMMINLFSEQVAGFYNSETKEMFLITEEPKKNPGLFDRLFGASDFDAEEQKITLSHEMAHALADQHFDLTGIDEAMKENEDAALAVSALVEGEATLVMLAEMTRGGAEDPQQVLQLRPRNIDRMFRLMNLASAFAGGRALRAAPDYFRQSLIFPYHQGTVFVAHLANGGGWGRIDRAFQFPPVSTEQILHPDKYLSAEAGDWPTQIALPETAAKLAGWKPLGEDTLGEFQIRLLLDGQGDGRQAAAGWDGDRYRVLERDGQAALLWATNWDSQEDASEFLECFTRQSLKRLRKKPAGGGAGEEAAPRVVNQGGSPRQIAGGVRSCWISRRGADVAVVEGLPDEASRTLLPLLLAAEKSDFEYRLPPVEQP